MIARWTNVCLLSTRDYGDSAAAARLHSPQHGTGALLGTWLTSVHLVPTSLWAGHSPSADAKNEAQKGPVISQEPS